MPQLIAGLYEIDHKIGAGGGGVVYLGRHIRLNKTVVLKADKRRLSTNIDSLRREVDVLKNLTHSYIPTVYDFIQEDGMVYTVMDYIEGESLDKMLARGEIPSQPQVIEWSRQLLEALVYLHGQKPHGILHADIKPANIMLRPDNTICLIDYNIALALGEEGAIKVGFSRGYASPEHYGEDYLSENRSASVGTESSRTGGKPVQDSEKTEIDHTPTGMDTDVTEVDTGSEGKQALSTSSMGTSTKRRNGLLVDVRSDIYSLGATLYHLISGKKPARDAREVVPLGPEVCSPAVSAILQKAMAPRPEDRYQTAAEMLRAFRELHIRDERVLRHKRRITAAAVLLGAAFLDGGGCTLIGSRQLEQRQAALTLSEYSANALAQGDITGAVQYALQAIPSGNSLLEAPVTAQAQKALTDALGVYDLSDGLKALDSVDLPGAPFTVDISPEGSRFAVIYGYELAVYDSASYQKIVSLPTEQSALADVVFADENLVIFAGQEGLTAYDLDKREPRWAGERATNLSLSADGNFVACVNRDASYAVVYQVSDGAEMNRCAFGGKHLSVPANDIFADAEDDIFALNEDGSLLAVSSSDGSIMIYDLRNPDDSLILYDTSEYDSFAGGFHGKYFAYTAGKSGKYEFGLVDVDKAAMLGGLESQDPLRLQVDEKGIYLARGNVLVEFDAETLEEKELAYTDLVNIKNFSVDDEYVLVTTDDDCFAFYDKGAHQMSMESFGESCDFVVLRKEYAVLGNRDKPVLRLLQQEDRADARLLAYDPRYAHDEARISHDRRTAMLFNYQGFRIYDMDGAVVAEAELPDAGHIYDQQFRKTDTESYLEVIWYDGTRRSYSAQDGSLLSEDRGEAPDKSLTEEFTTDEYRIVSALHEAPVVYDLKTGKEVARLESDAYLTYVTQLGEYIITEYLVTEGDGSRYGLLLNRKLETLAVLPNLCDVSDGELIFDYESGNLRHCRLYSLRELIELGDTY